MTAPGRPGFELILDWLEDRLPPAQAESVAAAVAADPRSAGAAQWLRGFLRTSASMPLVQAPPILRQRLRQHFRAWAASGRAAEPERRYAAAQEFDSRVDRDPVGVRGAADDLVDRHLAFRADPADVVLDVHPRPGATVVIEGQVLLADGVGAPVFEARATGPGFSIRTVDGDELGRFTVPGVPTDATRLEVTNGEIAVVMDLDLAEPRQS